MCIAAAEAAGQAKRSGPLDRMHRKTTPGV